MRRLRIALVALALGCGVPVATLSAVAGGTLTILRALVDARQSPHLDMAEQLLERGDLEGCCEYLRAELIQNGYDREVSALLALVESQLPVRAPAPTQPGPARSHTF